MKIDKPFTNLTFTTIINHDKAFKSFVQMPKR